MSREDVPNWIIDKLRSTLKENVPNFREEDLPKIIKFIDEYTLAKEAFSITLKFLLEEQKFKEITIYMALLYHKELAEEGVREFEITNNIPSNTIEVLKDYVIQSINSLKAKRGIGIGK